MGEWVFVQNHKVALLHEPSDTKIALMQSHSLPQAYPHAKIRLRIQAVDMFLQAIHYMARLVLEY